MLRITLFDQHSNSLCETLALQAAKSNGSDNKITLNQLKMIADGQVLLYPHGNKDTTAELIGDNHYLHIDRKVGDDYVTALIIEQVEIVELAVKENVVQQRYHLDNESLLN